MKDRITRTLSKLSSSGVGVATAFAVISATLFSPVFSTSFVVLLGRSLFVSMVLLLAFWGVQRLPERRLPRWLPRWFLVIVAVILVAPLATFALYLFSVGGDVKALLRSEPRMAGLGIIASTALVLGLVVTLTAQVREREARARTLALQLELERSRLERQTLDARLALLTAQIEPHFLFNTLANVQALLESGSPRAAPVLQSLIAYLRATLPQLHEGQATLARELALVRAYLDLMVMRMPDRLQVRFATDATLDAQAFPAMALLTLVENAVRHGIDPMEQGGQIEVGSRLDQATGLAHLWVADSGHGLSETAVPGTGLNNLRERLTATFGPRAQLQLSDNLPRGLRAEIVWPISK